VSERSSPSKPSLTDSIDPSMLATMSDEEVARTLQMNVAAFGDVARTIAQNPRSTIEPAQRESQDKEGRRALAGLGAQREARGISAGLDMEKTIGEGGMGVVRLATQRSLGRKVAVKTLRQETRNEAATLRLLREAWVTGTLEHPNIVPVYDVGLEEDGSPVIILKRIEGVEWAELIRDAKSARDRFGADDLLEHNLRVLIQLSNAVSLAHARGVLHRDLKPENVMIGKFGEVYLVDWGIAVSLVPDPTGRLPLASEQTEMAGTPCYMAPEMLGALGKLSERTDVYLLGAILHEILTGAPPHTGTFKQIVGSILLSTFVYPPEVPRELADIARKSMSRQPEDRYASAEELRLRIEWYLRHRGSIALSAEASRRLEDMKQLVATDGPPDAVHEQLYHLFAECRFGFKQAHNVCTDNETARVGLRQAVELVVKFELSRNAAEAAAGALAEIEDPDPELVAEVNAALRARDAEKEKMQTLQRNLERMKEEADPMIGRRTRAAATSMLGIVWTIAPWIFGALESRYPVHAHWLNYAGTIGLVILGWLAVMWGRESLTKTSVNRRMVATGALTFAAQLALQLAGHVLGLSFEITGTLLFVVWGGMLSTFAATLDRRFWFPVIGFFASFFVVARWPEARWQMMSASNGVLLVTFLVSWWRPRDDLPRWIEHKRQQRLAKEAARSR
jgi:serine/threonine-protein kinase